MLFIYITSLASNEIFSPRKKVNRKVGRAKDLSTPLYVNHTLGVKSNSRKIFEVVSGRETHILLGGHHI